MYCVGKDVTARIKAAKRLEDLIVTTNRTGGSQNTRSHYSKDGQLMKARVAKAKTLHDLVRDQNNINVKLSKMEAKALEALDKGWHDKESLGKAIDVKFMSVAPLLRRLRNKGYVLNIRPSRKSKSQREYSVSL